MSKNQCYSLLSELTIIAMESVDPRSNTQRLASQQTTSGDLAARVRRLEGAHLNGMETFPLWCTAIVNASVECSADTKFDQLLARSSQVFMQASTMTL